MTDGELVLLGMFVGVIVLVILLWRGNKTL